MIFGLFSYDWTILLVIPGFIISVWAQIKVTTTFKKYSQMRTWRGMTGYMAARRILDENGNELFDVDPNSGYGTEEEIFIAHHDAVDGVDEVGHYEVIRAYENGGRDMRWVVDVPGVEPQPEWDEYETIMRWHYYPEPKPDEPDEPDVPTQQRASKNYMSGIIFDEGGELYEATSNIARGEKIIPGMNCKTVSLSDILNALNSQGG